MIASESESHFVHVHNRYKTDAPGTQQVLRLALAKRRRLKPVTSINMIPLRYCTERFQRELQSELSLIQMQ